MDPRLRVGADRAWIAQPGKRVQVGAGRLAEQFFGRSLLELGELTDSADAEPMQFLGGDGADSPQSFDREWQQELLFPGGFDQDEAVGFAHGARDLGEELGARDPDRDGQADLCTNPRPQLHGDLFGRAGNPPKPADFEERLVDRQPLDERGRVAEDREYGFACRRVCVHPWWHDHGIRADLACLPTAHRGAYATGLRLVTRRQHDTAADDDGPAAQGGRITLLDRGVERIEIGMQHGRFAPHPVLRSIASREWSHGPRTPQPLPVTPERLSRVRRRLMGGALNYVETV